MLVTILYTLAMGRLGATGNEGVAQIDVYNRLGMPVQTLQRAMAHAQELFGKAGVRTFWRLCPNPREVPEVERCVTEEGSYSLGVVKEDKGLIAHRDRFTIGYTLRTAGRNNAAVIWPRVQNFAQYLGVNSDLLLGFAMAHEVGHLLSPVGHHSTGVMDPAWDRGDATDMARGRLLFCEEDALRMRQEAARKKVPVPKRAGKGKVGGNSYGVSEGSAILPR